MPIWLIVAAVLGGGYFYWKSKQSGAAGASGASFIPGSNATYYIAIDPSMLPVFPTANWVPAAAADGVSPAIMAPGSPSNWQVPASAPAGLVAAYNAGQTIALATWVGAPGQSAEQGVTNYGVLVQF